MTMSIVPLITAWAAKWMDCWEEPHCRSMLVAGTSSGSREEKDHVLDQGRVRAGAVQEIVQHGAAEISRMPVLQSAVLTASGRARRRDDVGFRHIQLLKMYRIKCAIWEAF
jgi:hypothetical protein